MKNKNSKNEKGRVDFATPPRNISIDDLRINSKTAASPAQAENRLVAPTGAQTPTTEALGFQMVALAVETTIREGKPLESWISEMADVFNCLFGQIGLPIELRAYVMALIGASEGQTEWFECSDRDLAIRLMGDEADGKTANALKKRVQRYRAKMKEWQQQECIVLVETDVGFVKYKRDEQGKVIERAAGKPELEFHSTKYRLPVLSVAAEALRMANNGSEFRPGIEITTKFMIGRLQGIPIEHDSAGRLDEDRKLRRYCSTGKSMFVKAAEIIQGQGGDTREFLNGLIQELEGKILADDQTQLNE